MTIIDDDSAAPATAVILNGTEQADVLTGTRFQDSISGLAGDDVLNGGVGADTLLGGLGNDSYIVDAVGDVVTENTDEGSDTVLSSISYSLGSQLENLVLIGVTAINATGNSLDNKLTGNEQANVFDGKTGADTLIGGLGNDSYVVNSANDVVIETSALSSELDVVNSSISYSLGNNVENLVLTGTDAINGTGNGLNNKLTGNNAANQLNGGLGADTMLGGLGNDVYTVDDVADVTTETSTLSNEIDLVNSSITHTLAANIEQLTLTGTTAIDGVGNNLANLITGNNAANRLDGQAGADTLLGGLGNDSYNVDNAGDVVTETSALANEIDEVFSSVSFSLSVNVEHLTLIGNKAINGTGNALKNRITGNDAANMLDGGTGVDTLIGGLGNDTYKVDSTSDTVIESSALANEIDTVESVVTFTLVKNVEHLTLLGGNAINGFGNVLANKITGNAAANLLNGGQGADTLTGGLGNDSYVVDDSGDVVVETSSLASEIDDVTSSVSFTLGNNLENLLLSGNSAINGQGNKAANQLTGNSAANVLNGMEGADTLTGGLGNDTYFIDQLGDVISETSALKTEIDTVNSFIAFTLGANLEVLNLQGNNDLTGVGNALANQLTGNNGANTLDGKAGNDTLQGGLGNDTYVVDSKGDKVIEAVNAGNDTILASLSLTLPAQVEALTLTGNKAINATGNELANLLTGNKAANKLSGGLGADTMDGGLGKDSYTVDNSGDVVIETSTLASEIDQVNSSVTYSLTANVEKLTLTGTNAINGSGNALANTLIGNASANTLNGGSGNDTLTGGNASDVLIGGAGADSINLTETVAATDTIKIAAG
ncbi:beta strand repeat-containing protein, partial [Methylocucumis oryzae]|uniref:beta strand repeat-containing protein n=1 Tax=Methylocucumis oryzae TaxID=1632867 RepID=UPI00103ACB0C